MSTATTSRWRAGRLEPVDDCEVAPTSVIAADSWLVADGRALALDLHRARFAAASGEAEDELDAFWAAAIAAIPREGSWFPRVELRRVRERPELRLLLRPAPETRRSLVLATHRGPDPRRTPGVKGPDLERLLRLRSAAQASGADEAVILAPDGAVVEGTTSAIAWWHGDALAIPAPELARVDSVTLRSVLALATALGVDVLHERARPEELDGHEVWALSALHGIRIATAWVDGPSLAEQPGRLRTWRDRLAALRRPIGREAA